MEKKNTRKYVICISLFLIITIALCVSLAFSSKIEARFGFDQRVGSINENAEFKIDFIDVGQGASCLISLPNGEHVLVDAGTNKSESYLVRYLKAKDIDTIDYFVLTHSDNDHTGGADKVYENFEIKKTFRPFILAASDSNTTSDPLSHYTSLGESAVTTCTTTDWINCVELMYSEKYTQDGSSVGSTVEVISNQSLIMVSGVAIRFWWPVSTGEEVSQDVTLGKNITSGYVTEKCSSYNNYSPIISVTYYDFDMVITGDADSTVEKKVMANLEASGDLSFIQNVDIYVAGHHGSNSSSCKEFLTLLDADFIVVQCGNSKSHPHEKFLARVEEVWSESSGGTLVRTDKNGDIVASCTYNQTTSKVDMGIAYSGDATKTSVKWWQVVVCGISVCAVVFLVPLVPKKRRRRAR